MAKPEVLVRDGAVVAEAHLHRPRVHAEQLAPLVRDLLTRSDIALADQFSLGELFTECRLEIPGESVLSVNLRVREVLKIETVNGDHQLRLGCEFVGLPGTRLAMIERYITKLERERKARESGLALG